MKLKLLIISLSILFANSSFAQQTILNVPSSSVLEKDQNFLEHESQFKVDDPEFLNVTNFYGRGIGNNIELDVTQFNLSTPASQNVSIGIGGKTNFLLDEDSLYKPTLMVGAMLPISMQGQGVGHWIYSTVTVTIPQSKTSFSAGFSSGSKQIFGENVNCFIGGIEQEITNNLGLYADWYSGNHAMGLAAFALGYEFANEFTVFAGYQVTNHQQSLGNSYIVELLKYF